MTRPTRTRVGRRLPKAALAAAALAAVVTLAGCLTLWGVHAADENGFFTALARQMRPVEDTPRAALTERKFGEIYAACMRPIESVREAERVALRDRFVADRQPEMRELRRDVAAEIQQLKDRFGVTITFPVV